jgi:UDP-N-acetylmuramoyl-L-alanyl-D-glutamate--2,6-diaminopimelate ligase
MIGAPSQSMELSVLLAGMDLVVPDLAVTDIATNSRDAAPGGLFLACSGSEHHGLEFLDAALRAGVKAVAWEPADAVQAPELPATVIGIEIPGLRSKLGVIADRFFDGPSRSLAVTGITGTNGKTTTAYLVAQALNQLSHRTGYMGTLGFGFPGELQPSTLTTPGCITVHRRLREMANAGADNVVAEVSSHALAQQRVDGVRFKVTALTNVSRDHLDYHGNMQSYAEAKARLFAGAEMRTAVINVGDKYGVKLAGQLNPATDLISVALVNTGSDFPGARLVGRLTGARADGLGLQFSGDFGEGVLESPLWGQFNAENLAMATGILLALGISLRDAIQALANSNTPPGRMERIQSGDGQPTVVVDFAHTPDALGKALEAVRDHSSGQVWCVFGCGGDRDRGKRGSMGAIASSLADFSIVTDDNPRNEDPQQIIADIVAGIDHKEGIQIVPDRKKAIDLAIQSAATNDVVLIAGKGHESVQLVGGHQHCFSDSQAARSSLGGAG